MSSKCRKVASLEKLEIVSFLELCIWEMPILSTYSHINGLLIKLCMAGTVMGAGGTMPSKVGDSVLPYLSI